MISNICRVVVVSVLMLISAGLHAAEDPDKCTDPDAANIRKCFSADTAIPDSPGLMIVGLGTEDVLRPTTPRELGAALTNGVDDQGDPVSGFAVDVAPTKLLAPSITQQQYVASPWLIRPLWNTQLSAAVGKNTDDDDETLRVGYGLSTVLWRYKTSDPVRNEGHQKCLKDALGAPPLISGAGEASSTTSPDENIANCLAKFEKESSSGTALTVGYAGSQISEEGDWSGRHSGASGAWASFSYAFDGLLPKETNKLRPELLLHWRELKDELVADPANVGSFIEQNSSQYGLLLRLHGKRMNFHAEKSWARAKQATQPTDDTEKFAVGIEWKLSENTWLVVAFGGEDGRDGAGDETHIRTGIKFGRVEQPVFN